MPAPRQSLATSPLENAPALRMPHRLSYPLTPPSAMRVEEFSMPFSTYLPEHMGAIRLSPSGPFVAGSLAELTLTYTAGTFGIDDTGMVRSRGGRPPT